MARSLSATLIDAQKLGLIRWPYLIAKIRRKWGGVIRYDFESLYGGGGLAEEKIIGMDAVSEDGVSGTQRFYLDRFQADKSGLINQIRICADAPGNYNVGIYADSGGEPGARLSVNNGWTAISSGWQPISIPQIYLTGGTYYWLAFAAYTNRPRTHNQTSNVRQKIVSGANYQLPNPAGSGFTTETTYNNLIAGWQSGAPAEVDARHCAAMPEGDGSLIRLRIDTDDNDKLYYQRLTSPGESSEFWEWTYLSIYNVLAVASCAYGAKVFQIYIDDDREINYRESTDNGETWGSWTLLSYSDTTSINGLACAYKPNGDICIAYLDQDTFYLRRRVSDSWQSEVSCPNSLDNKTGLALYFQEDWNFVVTTSPDVIGAGVYTCIYGDGERQAAQTWSDWESIILRESTEPYSYRSPFILRPDTTRLYFVEEFTQTTETDHIFYTHMTPSSHFDEVAWLEPVPMEPETIQGLAICQAGSYAWLTNANSVYRALATDDELDIADKLLTMDMRQYPDIRKGYVRIDIDNAGGIYNDFDRIGEELTIGLGFVTAAGNEYSLTSSFWITKQKQVSPSWSIWRSIYPTGVLGVINVEAQDAWDFLRRYRARRTLSWEADEKSVAQLLQYFLARAGLDFEIQSQSNAAQNFKPDFSVNKNTSYSVIIRNLLRMIPDQLFFREATAILRNPTTAESVDWVYSNTIGAGILVFRGKYGTSGQDPNRAEVWGDTFMVQDADYTQIQKLRDRGKIISTPDYPDVTRAGERASAEMRKAEILTSEESWMQTTVNCGLEPWDKLQITDQVSGVTDIIRRAIRMRTKWDKLSWNYQQQIIMGAD